MEGFIQAVKASVEGKGKTSVGTVVKITGDTCEVTRDGLPELIDVRLNAISGDFKNQFTVFPKVGSQVLVLEIENAPAETAVVKWTEVESVKMQIDEFGFNADKDGLQISNKGENFRTVINDMIDELNKILVIQGNSINKAAMNQIKSRFNKILK
ncbi:hypothetical protein [Tenacibaculum maritimum]|uniref:hypothetical protein n=1 Tax=Tenacibaculum maritimum TaxID=107401 RepID=UPI0012E68190|nr:hypothetical protein [Tenacibaculum maritimum]CAA0222371.1 conserved hypothetical protein [Tenacibaculum maritimum]